MGGDGGNKISELLEEWSRLVAAARFKARPASVARPVIEARSVLVEGATSAQIAAAEARLGLSLPPSYRSFLLTSNGAYGGHLGLQVEKRPVGGGAGQPAGPRSLLPVERVGLAAVDDPLSVDGSVPYQAPVELGQSTLHHPRYGDEVAYLAAPWAGTQVLAKRGHALWAIRIGWSDDPEVVVLLNPLVMDATGEWELLVLQPDHEYRYPSFGAWLEHVLAAERSRQRPADQPAGLLDSVSPANPAGIGAAPSLIGAGDDLDWLVGRVEAVLAPGVPAVFQELALRALEWIDIEHGGDRLASWVRRMLDDDLYADLPLVRTVSESPLPGMPGVVEVMARWRSGDGPELGSLTTDDLASLYEAAPDPIIARYLEQRGHRLVVGADRVELEKLMPAGTAYFRPETRREVGAVTTRLTSREIIDLATDHGLDAAPVARALARSGHADTAVDHLESRLSQTGDLNLLYTMAEIDTPEAWAALDRAAQSLQPRVRMVSLEAAARTGSLLLPPRAAKLIDRQDAEGLTALSALELQPTPLAADALLAAWRDRSHLGALRALARRRDPRIVDDCLLLLGDDEPAISQVGAETVRDLRHPSTTDSLLAALDVAPSDSVVAVVAHTLAMLQAPEAAPSLLVVAERVTNPQLADLLRRWAGQLVTGRAAPV